MNRCLLLMLGLLTCATGSGCHHYCNHNRGCVDWQQGCPSDPGCGAAQPMRGARLQHHRPRVREEVVEEEVVACEECGRRTRCGRDNRGVCDDCTRGSRRERRVAGQRGRRGRNCNACGGACTGECGADMGCGSSAGNCSGCQGGGYVDAQGYGYEGDMQPMGGGQMMGAPMSAPSGGCSSCSGGGSTGMYPGGTSYMGAPIYQGGGMYPGTAVNGPIVGGGMDGSSGWVPANMPSSGNTEPLPAPGASGVVYSQPGSSAPSPGSFPTPAR